MSTAISISRLPFLALIFLPGLTTKAQSFSIGAKTGLINSKFVNNTQNSSRSVFYIGGIVNKRLNRTYSIQAEINYSSQGSYTNGVQPIPPFLNNQFNLPSNTVYYGLHKRETILNNIEIPLLAKVSLPITTHYKYYLLLGPYISYLANAKNKMSGTGSVYQDINGQIPATSEGVEINGVSFNTVWNATSDFRKFNIGAEGGIGFGYGHPCSATRVFIEGRFGMNISHIHKSESMRTDKNQTSKTISAGLLYTL